jgi:ATP-dependent exoDNAse (exonuclease V) beta subunit
VVMAASHVSQVQADTLDEAALGTLVHDLLSEVLHEDQWPEVRARFEARWTLSPEDRSTVLAWADEVFANAESRRFFAPTNSVECEPAWMDDGGLIRPDRVVCGEDGWHVLDFKSGEVDVEKHGTQVQRYVAALDALESTTSRGWILYLNPWRLVEVATNAAPRIFGAD